MLASRARSPLRRRCRYDRFAARLLILGLLLRRRVVFPPIDCGLRYMQKALLARHLRGFEVSHAHAHAPFHMHMPLATSAASRGAALLAPPLCDTSPSPPGGNGRCAAPPCPHLPPCHLPPCHLPRHRSAAVSTASASGFLTLTTSTRGVRVSTSYTTSTTAGWCT